jgi:predicted acylesterase/phospholipase RssA
MTLTNSAEKIGSIDIPPIRLALSGGGFRATLFHLGVVRFLRDSGVLPYVTDISGVSGGSIIATHIVRNWNKYISVDDLKFDNAASEIVALVRQDVRGRIARRMCLGLFWRRFRRTVQLEACYEKFFARGSADDAAPNLYVPATNLTHGCISSLDDDAMITFQNDRERRIETSRMSDAFKAVASSAFPAFFPPIRMTMQDLGVPADQFLPTVQFLADGGIYDNTGVRRLAKLPPPTDGACHLVIASDAGRPFVIDARRDPGPIQTAWRATDIAMKRVGELDLAELSRDQAELGLLMRIGIDQEYTPSDVNGFFPYDLQRKAASMRTDLDRFNDYEILTLTQHGYNAARSVLSAGERSKSLASCCSRVSPGRWLCPDIAIKWQRDHDAEIWIKEKSATLKYVLEKTRDSDKTRLRLVDIRDIATYITAAILAMVIGVAWVGWSVWRGDRSENAPHVIYSMLAGSTRIISADPTMPGVQILEKKVVIDMRNRVLVPPELRDTARLSPCVQTYEIRGVKHRQDARYLVYTFSSQRRLMDIACISNQPHQVQYRRDWRPSGVAFTNVWTLIVDLEQHTPEIPFVVRFRVTRWNAYQAENGNFVGHLTSAGEENIATKVILPDGFKLIEKPKCEKWKQGHARTKERIPVDPSEIAKLEVILDGDGFEWQLMDPTQGWAYIATMRWDVSKTN